MGRPTVATVEAPELAIHLEHVDGLLLTFGGDGKHQLSHFGLVEAALQWATNLIERKDGLSHGTNSYSFRFSSLIPACHLARAMAP